MGCVILYPRYCGVLCLIYSHRIYGYELQVANTSHIANSEPYIANLRVMIYTVMIYDCVIYNPHSTAFLINQPRNIEVEGVQSTAISMKKRCSSDVVM